jgi:[ribosomal protein S5]-alanine N-acetyltransferase
MHLSTKRLCLRPLQPHDAPQVQRILGQSAVVTQMIGYPHPPPADEGNRWVTQHLALMQQDARQTWAVTRCGTDTLRGTLTLRYEWRTSLAELSYWLDAALWGQGWMSEAAGAVLGYAFRGGRVHRVYARSFAENTASRRVLDRIGMMHEATMRQSVRADGRYRDIAWYGALKSEYLAE